MLSTQTRGRRLLSWPSIVEYQLALSLSLALACGGGGAGEEPTDAGTLADSSAPVPFDAGPSCLAGSADCNCAPGASCASGLRCTAGLCKTCPAGTESCACGAADVCGASLSCLNGVCATAQCKLGAVGCPCDGKICESGLACASDNVCRTCRGDLSGCMCIGDACSLGLLCNDGFCRAPQTCASLMSAGTCFAHQACVEPDGLDAACVPDRCEQGYLWDASTSSCIVCPDCVVGTSCLASAAGIGDECAAAYRSCDETSSIATCGACLPGSELVGGRCLPKIRCGEKVCSTTEYCDRLAKDCLPLPCAAGSAKSAGASGACATCQTSCTGTGLTGRYWPFRTRTDKCVCETFENFYLEASAVKAERCDADGDGWVRREADDSAIREDSALLQNARCEIRRVDRVVLRDEYGSELPLDSCRSEGFVAAGGACTERLPLRLLETARNDGQGAILSPQTPKYSHGGAGRGLTGAELNGLTKACVNDLGDFDDDGIEDLNQAQTVEISASMPDSERLLALSYFMELYRSIYVAPSARAFGDLIIEERSRCDAASFPLHYSASDAYGSTLADGSEPGYWRSCTRFRDPSFDSAADAPGYDFAQFTCSSETGSCAASLPGPSNATTDYASVDPNKMLLRGTGLCDLNGKQPADHKFRGFGHHSEFRCMKATEPAVGPNEAPPSAFAPGGSYVFNACEARSCPAGDASCKEHKPSTDGAAADPYFDCLPTAAAANAVGFAVRSFTPYGRDPSYSTRVPPAATSYQGGCVNEDTEWGSKLCPGPEFATFYQATSFGRYSCYGDRTRWLWSAPGAPIRPTLYWASGPSATVTDTTPAWCF